jgi:DNA-binding IclR family transcriptional regulator
MKSVSPPIVKSADRALDVLELLARTGRAMPHRGIAAALEIPKSSLTQLLRNLEARGYLAFTPGPDTYVLGEAVFALAQRGRRGFDLAAFAQPLVERITRLTEESSSLNLLREGQVERVCGADSSQLLHYAMKLGARAPLYAVSSGKAILAFLPAARRDACLSRMKFEKLTPRTITSVTALKRELQRVAAAGVAYSIEEHTQGIVGVAVPVLDSGGHAIGAFNVAMPAVRYDEAHRRVIVAALRDAARELATEVNDSGPRHGV